MENGSPLLPAERQQRILDIIKKEFTARSSLLSETLGVSEMTIRRDLDVLEKAGLVERTHGGAVFRQERVVTKFQYQRSINENFAEKQQIAKKAASLIEPNDILFIGEGTTAAQIARFTEPGMPFSIFTNNVGVIAEVKDLSAATVVLLGGAYDPATHSLAGPLTMDMIHQINATKVFLGADGLSLSAGMTTTNLEIAVVERAMIRQTRGKVVVMANHTKFGLVAEMSVIPLKGIDILVTDRKVPEDFREDLERMGVEVLLA